MNCHHCQSQILDKGSPSSWAGISDSYPVKCVNCAEISWIEFIVENPILPIVPLSIPPLKVGTIVYVDNREHLKYLDPGTIINKSHVYYRIQFPDNERIWMPEHWIKAIPSQMI